MFGIGMTEIFIIAAVALIFIGPKKLPDIAKSLGKGYGEFRRSFGDIKETMNLQDTPTSSSAKPADKTQQIAESYRSQWEQKLPEPIAHKKIASDEIRQEVASKLQKAQKEAEASKKGAAKSTPTKKVAAAKKATEPAKKTKSIKTAAKAKKDSEVKRG